MKIYLDQDIPQNALNLYYKMRQIFLLQNVAKIYFKTWQFFIIKCIYFIIKCDRYYKKRRLL